MPSAIQTLRGMRIFHAALLTTIPLFLLVLTRVPRTGKAFPSVIVLAWALLCVTIIGMALRYRATMVHASEERLRTNPDDIAALQQWRAGIVLSCVFAECIFLFGFVAKITGASWKAAVGFFIVGAGLLLIWRPRLDIPSAI